MTQSIRKFLAVSEYRRNKQLAYNLEHHITPRSVSRAVEESLSSRQAVSQNAHAVLAETGVDLDINQTIQELEEEMIGAANNLEVREGGPAARPNPGAETDAGRRRRRAGCQNPTFQAAHLPQGQKTIRQPPQPRHGAVLGVFLFDGCGEADFFYFFPHFSTLFRTFPLAGPFYRAIVNWRRPGGPGWAGRSGQSGVVS